MYILLELAININNLYREISLYIKYLHEIIYLGFITLQLIYQSKR